MTTSRNLLLLAVLLPAVLGLPLLLASVEEQWLQPPPLSGLITEVERTERLKDDALACARSMEVTRDIIADLIEGRLSLREAANARRIVEESQPASLRPHPRPYPHLTTEDYYLQWAFGQAEAHLHGSPRQEEVLQRLRTEMQAYWTAAALSGYRW